MSTLERRLTKLEDALLAQPVQAFCLLAEPPIDATTAAWDEHRQKLEEAKDRGDFVAVVSPVRQGDRPHYDKEVAYFASEFEARLVEASILPSERGNDSLLADAMKDARGNVVGPTARDKEGREKA